MMSAYIPEKKDINIPQNKDVNILSKNDNLVSDIIYLFNLVRWQLHILRALIVSCTN